MKKHILTITLCISFFTALAQKENNIWLGGDSSGLNFNSGVCTPFRRNDNITFDGTNASICDKNGNLLFYTNGYYVYNRDFKPMSNGNDLNIGDYSLSYSFLGLENGAVIVPFPGDTNKYYLFHQDLNYISWDTFVNVLMCTHVFYDIIDMSLNNGLGDITTGQKDIIALSDTLIGDGGLNVVKHANGRDYWLICHKMNSDVYYRFLIDPYGIHGPYVQHIGYLMKGETGIGFSSFTFNLDGTKAAQLNCDSTSVQLYDFDRCTGEFYDLVNFKVSDTTYYVLGGAFSPSGKYFYATGNSFYDLWQFDISQPDIFASRKLIARFDEKNNPFPINFYGMRLGSDDKIYIHSYDWVYSLSVINDPDSLGQACHFVEGGLTIAPPGTDWNSFPNTVNYSLGALIGACDSLTSAIQLPTPVFTFSAYPNPFTDNLQLSISGAITNTTIEVYNLLGERVYYTQQQPQNYFVHYTLNLTTLPAGMYIVMVTVNGRQHERKVVKN